MKRIAAKGMVLALVLLSAAWLVANTPDRVSGGTVIPIGTVIVGTGNGFYSEFDQNGTLLGQLDTTTGSSAETGCAFDSVGDLITTNFVANNASEFDQTGMLIGSFGSGFNMSPESVVLDSAGHVFFGQADGTHEILEFNSTGTTLISSFSPTIEMRGTDWIDLAADQCTMLYTSEGSDILTYNICTMKQESNFNLAPLPGSVAYAHRIRPNGEVLVANDEEVIRLDAAGNQIQTYVLPGTPILFALNLDPDGTSFWTADLNSGTGTVFKVDIASGTVLKSWSAKGAPHFNEVDGICVKGEITAALPTTTPTASATSTATTTSTPTRTATPTATATPVCSGASASSPKLWPPNHEFESESVEGVTDPACAGKTTITITSILQDQPTLGGGSGHFCPDGTGVGTSTAEVRAEREGTDEDGRVYDIGFTATDCHGNSCSGTVMVCVPHDQGQGNMCVDHGPLFDSTMCP